MSIDLPEAPSAGNVLNGYRDASMITTRLLSACTRVSALILFGVLAGSACNDEDAANNPNNPSGSQGSNNRPPTIAGSPPTSVNVEEDYSFQPAASDPDGDSLTFSIAGRPSWASFDVSTGLLSGTPHAGDEGPYDNISIGVSDGMARDALGFSITVTQVASGSAELSWAPPTANTDGSGLTDLSSYKVYYGKSPGNYTQEIEIDNAGITTYLVENLSADTYYFVVTAINALGEESDFSGTLAVAVD